MLLFVVDAQYAVRCDARLTQRKKKSSPYGLRIYGWQGGNATGTSVRMSPERELVLHAHNIHPHLCKHNSTKSNLNPQLEKSIGPRVPINQY